MRLCQVALCIFMMLSLSVFSSTARAYILIQEARKCSGGGIESGPKRAFAQTCDGKWVVFNPSAGEKPPPMNCPVPVGEPVSPAPFCDNGLDALFSTQVFPLLPPASSVDMALGKASLNTCEGGAYRLRVQINNMSGQPVKRIHGLLLFQSRKNPNAWESYALRTKRESGVEFPDGDTKLVHEIELCARDMAEIEMTKGLSFRDFNSLKVSLLPRFLILLNGQRMEGKEKQPEVKDALGGTPGKVMDGASVMFVPCEGARLYNKGEVYPGNVTKVYPALQ